LTESKKMGIGGARMRMRRRVATVPARVARFRISNPGPGF